MPIKPNLMKKRESKIENENKDSKSSSTTKNNNRYMDKLL